MTILYLKALPRGARDKDFSDPERFQLLVKGESEKCILKIIPLPMSHVCSVSL